MTSHKLDLDPRWALRRALEPGRVAHELRVRWHCFEWTRSQLRGAEVTRVHEHEGAYTLELDLFLTASNGSGPLRLLGEVVPGDPPVPGRMGRELQDQPGGVGEWLAAVPELQLVVHRRGWDERLPVLDLLHRPDLAIDVLSEYFGGRDVEVDLVEHRWAERAILRVRHGPASVIVKGYEPGSGLPERTVSWTETLRKLAPERVALLAPLGMLGSQGAVVWTDPVIAGQSEWGPTGRPDIALVGGALRWLHGTRLHDLPIHDVACELEMLARSQRMLEAGRPQLAADILPTLVCISAGLVAMDGEPGATVLRDTHPGRFVFGNDRVSITDVDSLSVGEPAIDLGNHAAYLSVAGIPDGEARLHHGYQTRHALRERAGTWKDAALFRFGVELALTTDRADQGRRILAELGQR